MVKKRTSGPLKRVHPLLALTQTPKSIFRPKRIRGDEMQQYAQRLEILMTAERTPYRNNEEYLDEFLDAEFDMEDAITEVKKKDTKRKILKAEWSGQDVIAALEPYKTNRIIRDLNSTRVYLAGWFSPIYKLREYLKSLVVSGYFENFMTLCVTLNTLTLAIDHYGINKQLDKNFTNLNLGFTIIF